MKFFRLDLLTLLISLFIFNSCKNENTVGLVPNSQSLSGSILDTASVYTNTVKEDSIATSGIAKLPLGYLIDPVLGTTESDMITDINLPNNDATTGNIPYIVPIGSITIDSALLVLKYADGYYGGDTLSTNYTVNAYQLNERVNATNQPGNTYFDNKRWNYNSGGIIGSLTFQPRPLDSVKIYTIVHGAKDTLIKVPPQIRIPLSPSFIQSNLFGASSSALASNLIFQNTVKGFFLNVNKSAITGVGGTMIFQPPADSSIQVYVRVTNGTVVDTSLIYLNVVNHATQVNHVFSAQVQSALALTAQNAANKASTPDNYIYIQSGGLKSQITFPYIQKLFDSIPGGKNNVVINYAELVVTTAALPGDIPAYLVPCPKLTLYRYDISHVPYTVEDATSGSSVFFGVGEFGGYYNSPGSANKTGVNYHFLVTAYIQNIINGTTANYGTYMSAVDTTNVTSVDIAPTLATQARTVAYGYQKASPYRIKLNVIYTKIRK